MSLGQMNSQEKDTNARAERMTKNQNLLLFCIALGGLLFVLWLTTGSIKPTTGQAMIWFNGGLFALLVARFIFEYHFPKPNDVFLNCLTVFVSVSTLSSPPLEEWWAILRWTALATAACALFLTWDARHAPDDQASLIRRIAYALVTNLGKSTVIFSAVFLLALLSFFEFDKAETRILAITWGLILLIANLRFDQIFRHFKVKKGKDTLGYVTSFSAPRTFFFERAEGVKLSNNAIIGVESKTLNSIFPALVIGERRAPGATWYAANLLSTTLRKSEIDKTSRVVSIPQEEADGQSGADSEIENVVGLVSEGTSVSTLTFEVFGHPEISTGSLFSASHKEGAVYFQLFEGTVRQEASIERSNRNFVTANAEQIGKWDPSKKGFVTFGWVASENSPVVLVNEDKVPETSGQDGDDFAVGNIPSSRFPAIISLKDMVLYHSAVLGVTGSGKSFLTFELLEKCAEQDIKIVCVDPTGDYQRYLSSAVLIRSHKALDRFLDSGDYKIGILETAINKTNPIQQCHDAAEKCLEWCKRHRQEDEIVKPKPKVLFVMEEAHLLIPEWNFNPVRGLQDKVNLTSQIVLQARKYGLGFLIVAQRTANVSKSALNQCNTIFALQQFDQTGAEFLANYMGRHHVSSLPNLSERHGIVVGKASASQRPVLVRFNDQDRKLNDGPIGDMPDRDESAGGDPPERAMPSATGAKDLIGKAPS